MSKQKKFYVVWKGKHTGIFSTWDECKKNVEGYDGAEYKSFNTESEAKRAFRYQSIFSYLKDNPPQKKIITAQSPFLENQLPVLVSIATDAACSGNPGIMEYRGVFVENGKQLFYYKYPFGTNNIGEFLAIVHGLSYLKRHNLNLPLYTDSINAIKWVKAKQCKTKLIRNSKTEALFQYIERAENWLKTNSYSTTILKWETERWGEIPADFGRKN
ncbi:MAG: ribonuclease H family protein [Bacteroidales bacterium]|jgi:ribonuclease HI|nr:ribonuclease H family protein [Bacteroidales bacterium]